MGTEERTLKADNRVVSHAISQEAKANARYSASAEDLETVGCFLERQEIKEEPTNIVKPVVDRLLSGQVPQSTSVKPFKVRSGSAE